MFSLLLLLFSPFMGTLNCFLWFFLFSFFFRGSTSEMAEICCRELFQYRSGGTNCWTDDPDYDGFKKWCLISMVIFEANICI